GWGTVYQLAPGAGGTWTPTVLYSFNPINKPGDGAGPQASLVLGGSGVLYGTTTAGGTSDDGTVFQLTPSVGGTWTEKVLYNFTGLTDGGNPVAGLVQATTQTLYGTTYTGGSGSRGVPGAGCGK